MGLDKINYITYKIMEYNRFNNLYLLSLCREDKIEKYNQIYTQYQIN